MAGNIVNGLLGLMTIGSLLSAFVPQPESTYTSVTISVGQDDSRNDSSRMSGNIPAVNIFDIVGRTIGSSAEPDGSAGKWTSGSINPVRIRNNNELQNVPAEYVAVYATGTDAICISAVGLRNPTADTYFGWVADIGKACGMAWHWSETIVGSSGTTGTDAYRPPCVWISQKNDGNEIHVEGFSMHIIDFSAVTQARVNDYNNHTELMCASPARFSAWTTIVPDISPPFFLPPLEYKDDGSDVDFAKVLVSGVDITNYDFVADDQGHVIRPVRDGTYNWKPEPKPKKGGTTSNSNFSKRGASSSSTVISSSHPEHSAKELCESDTSYGPDAISLNEGLFCDMETKVLWPLCVSATQGACFDIVTYTIRGGSAKRDVVPVKNYGNIKIWGSEKA